MQITIDECPKLPKDKNYCTSKCLLYIVQLKSLNLFKKIATKVQIWMHSSPKRELDWQK